MSVSRRADKSVEALEAEIEEMERSFGETAPKEETPQIETVEDQPEPKVEAKTEAPLDVEEQRYKKRYADLRRHSQKEKDELLARITALESRTPESAPSITKEALQEWSKTNPQAAGIIRAIAEQQADLLSQNLKTKLKQLEDDNVEISKEKLLTDVRKVHSDFDTLITSNEFHDWAESQPEFVQNKIYDNENAKDVIWALNLFKKDTGLTTPPDAAEIVNTKSKNAPTTDTGKGRWTESKVEKLSGEDFEKHWTEIQASMKTPEFYDVSGAAR